VRLERFGQLKNPMTSSRTEPAAFRLVALNELSEYYLIVITMLFLCGESLLNELVHVKLFPDIYGASSWRIQNAHGVFYFYVLNPLLLQDAMKFREILRKLVYKIT
jgi:hypothetical protein